MLVLGSNASDIQRIRDSRDLPGMASFDHELRTLAARRKKDNNQAIQLPTGEHPFQYGLNTATSQ